MERNENGYSEFRFGNNSNSNFSGSGGGCPGTGEIWQGNGNMRGRGSSNGTENGNSNGNSNGRMNGNVGGITDENMSGCTSRHLAMVYSPYQCWRMLYSPDDALKNGTLFEELYKPLEDCVNE